MRAIEIINETETLDEITRPSTKDDAENILYGAGYTKIGSGVAATVFAKPNADHVLKLFDSEDIAYWNFVEMTLINNNVHFPKFKGKVMRVNNRYNAIRMEKLSRVPESSGSYFPSCSYPNLTSYDLARILHSYISALAGVHSVLSPPTGINIDAIMEELEEDQPGIEDACRLIAGILNNSMSVDLHMYNMMLRGAILVITDPVVYN